MTKKTCMIMGGVLAMFLAGCYSYHLFGGKKIQWQNADPETILVNYYEATRATVGGDRHLEFVLRKTEETDSVVLEVYRGWEDEEETCVRYVVPMEAVERSFQIIKDKKLDKWNEKYHSGGLGGGIVVCRFFDGEKQVRVSTDRMPENGQEILESIASVIASYQLEEYRVRE